MDEVKIASEMTAEDIANVEEPAEELKPCKNLANCTNVEFLRQTNRIRHQLTDWLKVTDVLSIRKHAPKKIEITDDMSEEEKKAAKEKNEAFMQAQWRQNLSDMLDACLETNAEKTVELLGLMCFLTPEETAEVNPFYLIRNFFEMLNDKDVMAFFSSLMRSELMTILMNVKA